MPWSFGAPSGICPRVVASAAFRFVAIVALCGKSPVPKYSIKTPCAAAAAAACGEAPFGAFAFDSYSSYSPVIPFTAL
jgi:hypothetical protein